MKQEGPLLERLTHRLSECPAEFLDEPRVGNKGQVYVDAVVHDLVLDLGGGFIEEETLGFCQTKDLKRRNLLRLILVCAWLFHDEWFISAKEFAKPVLKFLKEGLIDLAGIVAADRFVNDPDRREELARLCLSAVGLRPQGETLSQAMDRLKSLGSVEHSQVLKATKAAMEHARMVREKMREQAAREAAARVSSE